MNDDLIRQLTSLNGKIYKALNIYEEENDIEIPNRIRKNNLVIYRKTFCNYIQDDIIEVLEGIILSIGKKNNYELAKVFADINASLWTIVYHNGKEAHNDVKQKIFGCINKIQKIINDLRG